MPSATSAPSATVYSLQRIFRVRFFAHLEHSLGFLCAEQFEEFGEVVLFPRLPQLLDLPESVRFDLQLDRVLRRVLHQGVARLKFEITGHIADPDQHGAAK